MMPKLFTATLFDSCFQNPAAELSLTLPDPLETRPSLPAPCSTPKLQCPCSPHTKAAKPLGSDTTGRRKKPKNLAAVVGLTQIKWPAWNSNKPGLLRETFPQHPVPPAGAGVENFPHTLLQGHPTDPALAKD